MAASRRWARATSLASTVETPGSSSRTDLDADAVVLLEHGQSTSSPRRPRLRRPGWLSSAMCCSSPRTKRGTTSSPLRKPDGDDVHDAAVDDGAGVEVGDRLGGPVAGSSAAVGCAPQAQRLEGRAEVVPLGDRQAHHARGPGRWRRRWAAASPAGSGRLVSGRPEQEAHEQADEEARDGGHELVGGHVRDGPQDPACRHDREVGRDDEADDAPGRDPGQQQQASLERGSSRTSSRSESRPTRAMARMTPSAPPSRRMNLSMAAERYQKRAVGRRASPSGTGAASNARSSASRSVRTGTTSRPAGSAIRRARPPLGPLVRPPARGRAGSPGGPPRGAVAPGRAPAGPRPAARPRRRPACPPAMARSRCEEAIASASGRSRAGSLTAMPPVRLA